MKNNINKFQFYNMLSFIDQQLNNNMWIPCFKQINESAYNGTLYAALATSKAIKKAMIKSSWDINFNNGRPGFIVTTKNNEEKYQYKNFPVEGFESLVLQRQFAGRQENYFEVSQEFVLCFNLYYNKKKGFITIMMNLGMKLRSS